MNRRVHLAHQLFARSRAARVLFVAATWPFVHAADRLRGVDPPARWRDGWHWATARAVRPVAAER